jgi:hypothetical protein
MTQKRACSACNTILPETEDYFYRKRYYNRSGNFMDHYDNRCIKCHSKDHSTRRRLNKGFASLKPDYCECCGETDVKIMLDHCHDSGMFRGFVCKSCNLTLYYLGDNFESVIQSGCKQIYKNYMKVANQRAGKLVNKVGSKDV